MAKTLEDIIMESQEIEQETPPEDVFMAPSITKSDILSGKSYSHFSPIPSAISEDMSTECVLGVDEAGRGPVLGPMVYALFYLPIELHHSLLAETHHFDDSKVLTAAFRSTLMRTLCTSATDLYTSCGWATRLLSARDISANMFSPQCYNLNAQAMDATIALIQGVLDRGVNVKEIYIDTIGRPETYQRKLERIWPSIKITVAKKADSLYPCVSAASVCAKVTRDAALDVCYEAYSSPENSGETTASQTQPVKTEVIAWGSGYPSDARTSGWLKKNMDPVFGWGNETRFSWGTAKEILEAGKNVGVKVEWPDNNGEDENDMKMTDYFAGKGEEGDEMVNWFGKRVTEEMEVF
ncbi:ribonuclease HI large subunit [Delitschia confertaspora ATCC 74209]|uniref:Ribonuclease n=1 Tax=Delitschia confertaspora ATCC 74209 TaxID=1513339 RepID=A0A9P4JW09_9PLEO|nr:ribonuclease HI large subunit [Delitschia confertaspora ATCC 74209]